MLDKMIRKPKWKGKGTRNARIILKKNNKLREVSLANFKTYL